MFVCLGNSCSLQDVCLFVLQGVGLWKSCSLQGFGLWNLWSLLGLFGVLTLQSVRGAHSCSQGVILSEVIQIALCPLNSLGKREERHKRIQAVSPSILLAKEEVNEEEE